MYGYVRVYEPELKVRQAQLYRAVYCGLCRSMGHVTGQLSRLTLTYDLVLLAAVRMILTGEIPECAPANCVAHPFSRRPMAEPNESLRYAAAFSAVLAEAKRKDDLTDERGVARLKPFLAGPALRRMAKRAGHNLPPDATRKTEERLAELRRLEEENCDSADRISDVFGAILASAFGLGLDDEAARIASAIGRGVGRFAYLCDAADDMVSDAGAGRYNPFLAGWGELALADGKVSERVRETLLVSAPLSLEEAGEAVEELDREHPLTPIVQNIVYLGLPASLRRVLSGEKKGKTRIREWRV